MQQSAQIIIVNHISFTVVHVTTSIVNYSNFSECYQTVAIYCLKGVPCVNIVKAAFHKY